MTTNRKLQLGAAAVMANAILALTGMTPTPAHAACNQVLIFCNSSCSSGGGWHDNDGFCPPPPAGCSEVNGSFCDRGPTEGCWSEANFLECYYI
jgi:hypothetical protein